jgi:UDPglucose 6-dehydrogenase
MGKAGLIGKGFVGNCVYEWFKPIPFYSLEGGDFEKVSKCKFIFMCLPTPYSDTIGFDLKALIENIERLPDGKNIVIKSTLLAGTTEKLSVMYPQHKFFYNPEFLVEKTAMQDFKHPDRQIVGHTGDVETAEEILGMLPEAQYQSICDAKDAEFMKIMANDWLALKVIYANQMYDYAQHKDVDYDNVIKMITADSRMGESHWQIFTDGYRGYGGHCFPKDMKATVLDSKSELLTLADKINDSLRS